MLAMMTGKKIKLRPQARRFSELGAELDQLDDMWLVATASTAMLTLQNTRTNHIVPLGTDHVKEYLSDASKASDGTLALKSQVFLQGKNVSVEPIIHSTAKSVPAELDDALRLAKGLVIQGSSPLSLDYLTGKPGVLISSFSAWVQKRNSLAHFNSGSISGLAPDTTYYVYVDNPPSSGGPVPYLATPVRAYALTGINRYYIGRIRTPIRTKETPSQKGETG